MNMTRKFKRGDRVKTTPNACCGYFTTEGIVYVGTVIDYDEDDMILVKFDNFTDGHSGSSFYLKKDIEYDRQHLYVREDVLCLLEGEKNMTIKELKVKFPPEEYRWSAVHNDNLNDDYQDDDLVLEVIFTKNGWLIVYWEKAKRTLSKAKLDRVIELNKKYFLTPFISVELDNAMESLREAEKDCGKEIYDTGLLDIIGTIISRTKEHNIPNETFYKVYEALGYVVE